MTKKRSKVKHRDFTFAGYNDKPKPCLNKKCSGMVKPTWNANVGKCDTCDKSFSWSNWVK